MDEQDLSDKMQVWVGNLGRYNEGDLVGAWIDLPKTTEELDAILSDDLGLTLDSQEALERGLRGKRVYEEYFIADYNFDGLMKEIGFRPHEYANLHDVNCLAAVASEMDTSERECLASYADDNCITSAADMAKMAYAIHSNGDTGGYFAYEFKPWTPTNPQDQAFHDDYMADPMNLYVETCYPEERLTRAEAALEHIGEGDLAQNLYKAAWAACESDINSGYVNLREHGYVDCTIDPPDFEGVDMEDIEADYLPAPEHARGAENPIEAERAEMMAQAAMAPSCPAETRKMGR